MNMLFDENENQEINFPDKDADETQQNEDEATGDDEGLNENEELRAEGAPESAEENEQKDRLSSQAAAGQPTVKGKEEEGSNTVTDADDDLTGDSNDNTPGPELAGWP